MLTDSHYGQPNIDAYRFTASPLNKPRFYSLDNRSIFIRRQSHHGRAADCLDTNSANSEKCLGFHHSQVFDALHLLAMCMAGSDLPPGLQLIPNLLLSPRCSIR